MKSPTPLKPITWTVEMRERLRKAQKDAHDEKQSTFIFDGQRFSTHYAYHLIDLLDARMP